MAGGFFLNVWKLFPVVMVLNRIREVMKSKNITQKMLESMTGIDQASLSRIINERNKRSITLDTAKRIAKALGCTVEDIWPD